MQFRVVQGRLQRVPPVERHARPTQIPGMRHCTSALQGHGVDEPEALHEALRRSLGMPEMDPRTHEGVVGPVPMSPQHPEEGCLERQNSMAASEQSCGKH